MTMASIKKMITLVAAATVTALGGLAATTVAAIPPAQAYGEDFYVCQSGHSGVATTVTSCAFAESVRYSYITQDGSMITAYSPVTGQYYDMQCASGFIAHLHNTGAAVPSVRCVGGNNAVVIVF